MTFRENLKYAITTSLAACLMSQPAWGQEEPEADTARALGTVFVTAQKRAQNLQDVPIAISTFDADDLVELGATSLEELAAFVPGAHLDDARGAGQPTWVIRGVGLSDFNSNNTPTAAIYYDEAYLVSSAMSGVGLFDIERIEVLKGPQGGLYGRNTSGGAVRIVSNKPDLEESNGYAQASYGQWDRWGLEGAFSAPIIEDKLAVRVSAVSDQGGGWQDSLATPEDDEHGDRDYYAVRGQALFAPSDDLEVLFKVDFGQDQSETTLGRSTGAYDPLTGDFCSAVRAGQRDDENCIGLHNLFGSPLLASDQSDNGETVLSNPINELQNEWLGLNFSVDKDLGFASFVSISSYIECDYVQFFDYDATPLEFVSSRDGVPDSDTTFEQWSQEFRLISPSEGPLTWLVGGVYAEDDISTIQNFGLADLEPVAGINRITGDFDQKTESWAVFGQFGYDLSDTLNLNASLRYTDEDKSIDYASFAEATGFGEFPLIAPVQFETELDSNWSGHIGLDWKVAENALLYAKYSRAIKSGGFFGAATDNGDDVSPYEQETNDAFEIGLKSNPTDELQVNLAAYYYDYQDVQGLGGTPGATGAITQQLTNLGDAEHIGLELDANWVPSQIPGFSLGISASWLDAEIVSSDLAGFTQDSQVVSFEGLTRDFAPDFSYAINAQQEAELSNGILGTFSANYSWREEQRPVDSRLSILDYGLFRQDAYGLLNLRASLEFVDHGWEVAIAGENVTDETYALRATGDDGGSYLDILGRPASWTIQARKTF